MFEFVDPCSDFSGATSSSGTAAAAVDQVAPFSPGVAREDLPIAWAYADARGWDYRGALDAQAVAELEQSAASGGGIRTLYGDSNPPPPGSVDGSGGGGDRGGAGGEIMGLIGAGFLYAAVDRILNKDKRDDAQALLFAVLGGGLVYYARKS